MKYFYVIIMLIISTLTYAKKQTGEFASPSTEKCKQWENCNLCAIAHGCNLSISENRTKTLNLKPGSSNTNGISTLGQ